MSIHKKYPPLDIGILVCDLKTGEEIRRHKIDYNDRARVKWLQSLCIWAWNNHCSVETFNVKDEHLTQPDPLCEVL